jgi:hypothetical protein
MAVNITLQIIDRLEKLETAQQVLAAEKVAEAAAIGEIISLVQATAPTVTNRIFKEIPVGLCNGTNQVFTMAKKSVFKTEEVYMSGCLLRKGATADYMINHDTKTITMNYAPESDDIIEVNYDFVLNGN